MLKENEYIRTDLGNILKYTGKEKEFIDKHLSISNKKDIEFLGTIVKHSKNIIDLIEVGDFINGMKIDDIGEIKRFGKTAQKCLWVNIGDGIDIIDEEIKDILTKEQHMQNCYKIAEENSSIN